MLVKTKTMTEKDYEKAIARCSADAFWRGVLLLGCLVLSALLLFTELEDIPCGVERVVGCMRGYYDMIWNEVKERGFFRFEIHAMLGLEGGGSSCSSVRQTTIAG